MFIWLQLATLDPLSDLSGSGWAALEQERPWISMPNAVPLLALVFILSTSSSLGEPGSMQACLHVAVKLCRELRGST